MRRLSMALFADDDVCPLAVAGDMPPAQGFINVEPEMRERRQLPHYIDFLRDTPDALWCEVSLLTPRLNLYWRYTAEQERAAEKWECSTVWLHSRACPNGEVYRADVYEDLRDCINQLAHHKSSEKVRYSLLVNQQGMAYDANRLGGDCDLVAASGRPFTFSVRRDNVCNRKILLAIAWR
jgi:hypothetical protein